MKNILFPTDFSSDANNALEYALELAKLNSAKIILLNAYHMPYNRADIMVSVMGILKEDSEAGLKQTLERIKKNPRFADINCETKSRIGDVVSVCAELIKDEDIDLIVMGTKGASGVLETIIGSNTASVVKNVACPVLAVPSNARYTTPRKIGFAYDLKEIKNAKDLRFLSQLIKIFNAELQIYSVIPEFEQEVIEKSQVQLKLSEYFNNVKTEIYFAVKGDIIEGIRELVESNKPDWTVMLAKKYTLFETIFHTSMTKTMVFQTDKPLLVLHNYNS
ncbi:MAG: universal stress protein [Bacteroidetes bacterium]|nr:universal stress protein [Bacteroidota bacterium]HET6244406.1 universal stress protein [Bacteroidia bacterium]